MNLDDDGPEEGEGWGIFERQKQKMKHYPSTPEEIREARNAGYYCRHPYTTLLIIEEVAAPTPKDLLRRKQTYWCEDCRGIKYALMQGNGVLRSWKNG